MTLNPGIRNSSMLFTSPLIKNQTITNNSHLSLATFIFSAKADCCKEHFEWNYNECVGSSLAANSGEKWYADWTSDDQTCKNDGNAPAYMVDNESQWLHDDRDKCCKFCIRSLYSASIHGFILRLMLKRIIIPVK